MHKGCRKVVRHGKARLLQLFVERLFLTLTANVYVIPIHVWITMCISPRGFSDHLDDND